MPWTEITRLQYRRDELRFASDTTDAEWALMEPVMPEPAGIGRPRTTNLREVVNAILYVLWTGCPWRALPKEFPPRSTVRAISTAGHMTERGLASTALWSSRGAKASDARPPR